MSLKSRLGKYARIAAVGATMLAPAAFAQENEASLPVSIEQPAVSSQLDWDSHRFSPEQARRFQAIYDSLPDKYKAFYGKDFETRFSMKEEHSQRLWQQLSKEHPGEDIYAGLSVEMGRDNLTIEQRQMAEDLVYLGRPSATIDSSLPMAEQLRSCGFDKVAEVAGGYNFKDYPFLQQGEFIHQMSWATQILDANPTQKADLKRHLQEITSQNTGGEVRILNEGDLPQVSFTNVNGSEIQENSQGLSAAGAYSQQVVLDVASKLKHSQAPQVSPQILLNNHSGRN